MEHNSSFHTFRGPPLCEAHEALWASSAHLSKETPAGWCCGAGAVFSLGLVFRLLPVLSV